MITGDTEAVLEHLLFHKAIIHEEDRAKSIDHYLEILESSEDSCSSPEPVEKSIEMVFELVLSHNLNPWDIDLLEFTRLYYERLKEDEVNFIIAGKLLFMAWSILRLQSEEVLALQEREDMGEFFCSGWDFEGLNQLLPQEEQDANQVLDLEVGQVELEEMIRRRATRPVSLVELLDAFDEASREAEINLRKAALREAKKRDDKFDEKAHTEELERDVEQIWERINGFGGGPLTIEDICRGTKKDFITVFISILFLARKGKISIWQDDLPDGTIFFEVHIPWDIGTLEDVESEAEVRERAVM